MSIYESAVKKPVTTILIFVAIAILGLFSLSRLAIDLYPKIETSNIMVVTSYAGASASDIENNVTKTLENTLNSVSNIKHVVSNSRDNISVITLQFNEGVDIEVATNDVRDKLDAVSNFLPDGIDRPVIFKFGTDDIPITMLSVQAKESTMALSKILEDKVSNALARIDGVGAVSIMGASKREIQIYCDPAKLEAYNLSVESISQIVGAENRNIPAGSIDLGSKTNSLRVQGEFVDARQLNNIVVASVAGRNVYLSDVARVEDTHAENEQESYNNNVRGAMIMINKQSGANSVAISRAVHAALPQIQSTLPSDVKLGVLFDTSENIVNTINSLRDTIAITFVIVILVVLFFLGRWRATFIIGLTIPISLIASFIYLMATGNTLNIISLSSLSIAIGMVVDDAIVVLENVTTHIEQGSYPKQAAVHGTNEVGISVVASTLTMLAVFLPLTMIQGLTGILFRQLGWIVSIIMIISTVAALTLTPMLCSQLLRRDKKQGRFQRAIFSPIERFLDAVDRAYEKFLGWAVRHRILTIVSATAIFFGSLMLSPILKTEFFPQADNGYIMIRAEYPVGTGIELPRDFA
ncbi:efflux RND transporter permease subunit, partial [Porphyromonas loveana]|uniref:efflux RND transporter permease subunit n=1 Tax=Porphyromonas loveana TaxID=1884669 RepID=UPI0035A004C5